MVAAGSLRKVDLHLHSPAGGDYRGDPHTTAAEIRDRCLAHRLDLVVLADHMTLEGWTEFSSLTHPPVFLPGVELKLAWDRLSAHLVAIFPPCRVPQALLELRRAFSHLTTDIQTLSMARIHARPAAVLRFLKESGALTIAAHMDRLADGVRALAQLEEAGGVDAVEFDDPAAAGRFELNGLARVVSSDAHSLEEIGRRYTELPLNETSFEGLAAALRNGKSAAVAGDVP